MTYEILVIDDNLQAAKEFARYVTIKTKLDAIATDSPDEAIQLIRTNSIKVALLDQRMPLKEGTELYKELISIDPLLKAIMLTGEADGQEVGDALKLGFNDYVHKSKVEKLPERVLLQYCSYHTDISETTNASENPIFTYKRPYFWDRNRIDFYLISAEVCDPEYILPNDWKTIVKINAGEKTTCKFSRQKVAEVIIESEQTDKLNLSTNAKIPVIESFTSKLETAIQSRFKERSLDKASVTDEVERELSLPNEPTNPAELHVKSRQYEQAPVYQQLRLLIRKNCSFCNTQSVIALNVNHLAPKIATRQIDYMSDGDKKITDTGFLLQ